MPTTEQSTSPLNITQFHILEAEAATHGIRQQAQVVRMRCKVFQIAALPQRLQVDMNVYVLIFLKKGSISIGLYAMPVML